MISQGVKISMKEKIYYTGSMLIVIAVILAGSGFTLPYDVPVYPIPKVQIWDVQSIDTMKYSRDKAREALDDKGYNEIIKKQIENIKATGATHVAIGTPYDSEFDTVRDLWIQEIRNQDLSVWHRGNWSGWEGWFEYEKIPTDEHIIKTLGFIRSQAHVFRNGDIFEPCPECENGGPGDPRFTKEVKAYKQFLIDLYEGSSTELAVLAKEVKVLFSMNGDVASLIMDEAATKSLGGIISMDHYVATGEQLANDATNQAVASQSKIYLSELGAPIPDIHGRLSEIEQAEWISEALEEISKSHDIIGINYWVNRGGTTALWERGDTPRAAVAVVTRYFSPTVMYGVVLDKIGFPVKDANVEIPYGTYTTDKEGYFEVPVITGAQTNLTIKKPGYKELVVLVTDAELGTQQNLTLEKENESLLFRLQKKLYSN